jgi:hypothetical protein
MHSARGRQREQRLTGAETVAQRRRATVTGDGEAAGCGPGDAASDRSGRGASYRDNGGARDAAVRQHG